MMLPLKSIGLLGLTPILQSSACRFSPLFSQQDLRPQCLPRTANSPYIDPKFPIRTSIVSTSARTYSAGTPQSKSQHHFSYRIGAAFSAKGLRFEPKRDHYLYDPVNHPRKDYVTGRPTSGQDAFFVSRVGNGSTVAFGVADGVGGWSNSGIDSAHFSHGLCEHMIEAAENTNNTEERTLGAGKLLQTGYNAVVADELIAGGGSTACVAVGNEDGSLQVAK